MRAIVIGDLHLKAHCGNRKRREAFEAQRRKIHAVYHIADYLHAHCILQTGDLFDGPEPRCGLLASVIQLLKHKPCPFFTVLGQHDQYLRTGLDDSPVRVLAEARELVVLTRFPQMVGEWLLYGASYDEVAEKTGAKKALLVSHRGVRPAPMFPGDTPVVPRQALRQTPGYQVIFYGDHHGRFVECWEHRIAANPGALWRQTRADIATPPSVFFWTDEAIGWKKKLQELGARCEVDGPMLLATIPLAEVDAEAVEDDPFTDAALAPAGPAVGIEPATFRLNDGQFDGSHNFPEALRQAAEKEEPPVRRLILEHLEDATQ
jgi:hypothetical protein